MKTRAATFVAAMIASVLSSANLSAAPDDAESKPDSCLTSPRDYAPPGTRWRYRVEHSTGRHCWFLKDGAERAASKASDQTAAEAGEPPAPAPPRKKVATPPRALSDAHAEFSQRSGEQDTRPAPAQSAPAPVASVPLTDDQPSAAKSSNMLAPTTATRWPDPMSIANSAVNAPAAPAPAADQGAEVRAAPATTPPAKPQVMPRAVPPVPVSEQPMSLPMLITVVAGGLSVFAVLVSVFFAWRASRAAQLMPNAPMPPLDLPDQPRRPGDMYRERKRTRAKTSKRRAA